MTTRGKLKLLSVGLIGSIAVFGLPVASAASANISHSYHASGDLVGGDLVSLDQKRPDYVQATNTGNGARLLGVAVSPNDSLLAVDSSTGLAQIATSGTVNALVNALNGDIKVGDAISASPFNGVGMKAPPGTRVIGLAQTTLSDSTAGSKLETIKNQAGKAIQIRVGYIKLGIAVGTSTPASTTHLNYLQKIAQQLTGHAVPLVRIIISLAIVLIALAVLITLAYSAIYSSITAIGRNPLAKSTILSGLREVLAMSALVAAVAAAVVYFLLR